jgi:hypothetical protein
VPLNNCGGPDQYHRVQTARLQPAEPDPEQAVDRKQPGPTRPLAAKNMQLMTESAFASSTATRLRNRQAPTETIERTAQCMSATLRRRISKL